jgi:hypothetical protein
MLGYVFPIGEARGEKERERAHGSKWSGLLSLSSLTLFIGKVEIIIYILFYWWGEIL